MHLLAEGGHSSYTWYEPVEQQGTRAVDGTLELQVNQEDAVRLGWEA